MTYTVPAPLRQRPAFQALQQHYEKLRDVTLTDLFAADSGRGTDLSLEAEGIYFDYSKHRVTDETIDLLVALARGVEPGRAAGGRCSAASASTSPRTGRCCMWRCARRRARSITVDGADVVPDVHEVLDRMARVRRPGPVGRVDRAHRQADPQRRQHRHRRLRPRPGDGLRGAAALLRPRPDLPVRLQRGRHRLRRGHPRPRPGGDAVHRLVQDVHHAGDDDQRALGAGLVAGRAGRRGRGGQALRRGVHQRRARSPSSASTPRTCSASGTGSAAATRWTRRSACPP